MWGLLTTVILYGIFSALPKIAKRYKEDPDSFKKLFETSPLEWDIWEDEEDTTMESYETTTPEPWVTQTESISVEDWENESWDDQWKDDPWIDEPSLIETVQKTEPLVLNSNKIINPSNLRDAIIWSEILQKPKSLRK